MLPCRVLEVYPKRFILPLFFCGDFALSRCRSDSRSLGLSLLLESFDEGSVRRRRLGSVSPRDETRRVVDGLDFEPSGDLSPVGESRALSLDLEGPGG